MVQQDLHAAWNHGGDVSQENGNWWSSISANATINCRLYLLLLLLLVAFICDRQHHHQDMVWWANGNCRRIVADNSSCKIWFVGQLLVLVLDILNGKLQDMVWFVEQLLRIMQVATRSCAAQRDTGQAW